jgi:hypothetical protein
MTANDASPSGPDPLSGERVPGRPFRSATRNLVVGLGLLLFGLDVIQDISYVSDVLSTTGWTGRLIAEIVSLGVRNLLLLVGLGLIVFRQASGWTLLALLAIFTLIRRIVWFVASESAFGSISSPAFQGAYAAADLLFRLLCLTVLVDLVREGHAMQRPSGPAATPQGPVEPGP